MSIDRKPIKRHFWLAAVLIGIIVFLASSFYFFRTCVDSVEGRLINTANYMKVQCATYTHYNNGSETQGLLRAVESSRQVRNNISENSRNGIETDSEQLREYAKDMWLHGILLLDSEGNVVCEYVKDSQVEQQFLANCNMDIILAGEDYTKRNYAQRIHLDDGSYINMAATARKDSDGMVVTYYYISQECAMEYSLTLQSLLEGYEISTDGTIIVADEGQIIACNETELIGQHTADNVVIQKLKKNADSSHIMHISNNHSYGIMLKQRDYYIYAYVPDMAVFATLPQNVLICMVLYAIAVALVGMFVSQSDREYLRLEKEQEIEYAERLREEAKKADAANRAKTEFLQRMSHDIRTPINGICGMVEVADYYPNDLDKQAECRTKIKEASNILLELINEVLDMGKLESGEIKMESRPFELHELLEEVIDVIDKLAAEQNVSLIQEDFDIAHCNLLGSPLHIKRLLLNIMSNAVKYNKENGSITIKCRELPSEDANKAVIEFVCEDTGIGMSEEYQKRIFDPFSQEDSSSRSRYGGSGLGMPIAKGLADKMGGTLTLESEKDKGSTFTVTIPFEIDKSSQEKVNANAGAAKPDVCGYHVLLVEDNELNMEIAEFGLEREGVIIQKAWNGREAVEIFEKSKLYEFDAIITDVMMPEMDGYEETATIRAMTRADAKSIPIIAMTANAFTDDRIKSKEAGMNAHISKPLNSALVVETLYRLVSERRVSDPQKEA